MKSENDENVEFWKGVVFGDMSANNVEKVQPKPTECDDCISREAVLEGKIPAIISGQAIDVIPVHFIKQLSPVQPKQRTGMWVEWKDSVYNCSVCGCHTDEQALFKYCPNCGAKMGVLDEDNS